MWNLARVSCVPDSVEVHGYVLISEEESEKGGRYAYGFMDNPELVEKIINALCKVDGVTAEQVAEGSEPHYYLDVHIDTKIECQDRIIRGEMSILEYNGTPLAYILTNSKTTAKLLTVLNQVRIDI